MASSESLEYSTILAHIEDINQRIALNDLSTYAGELVQARLITLATYQSAVVTSMDHHRMRAILTAEAMEKIKISPQLFDKLISILARRDYEFASILHRQCRATEPQLPQVLAAQYRGNSSEVQGDAGISHDFVDNLKRTDQMTATVVQGQDFSQQPSAFSSHSTIEQKSILKTTSNIQDSGPLVSYVSYLRELYSSLSQTPSHKDQHWTHLPRCEFIQLAMIGLAKVRRGDREEEMVRLAQMGKIETIMNRKEPINIEELFQTDLPLVKLPTPLPPRRILIEGVPGGGKSTLALHLCHKWAQGNCAYSLSRFDLVIIVYLRDEVIQNATTLTDILPARNSGLSKLVASHIQDTYGKNVLFVFDGWDEFPYHLQTNSLVSTIIRQPQELSLHQSTVLITTRPVSSGNLLHIADRRVEILGFTQHQIREYIEKALDGSSTQIQKLFQHLDKHPVIEGYCYVPLHAAILVHIFLTMNETLPITLHQLFCNLVLCCIIRELETHHSGTDISAVTSLDDLPDILISKLNKISLLAYEGVMHDKVIFYQKDLQDLKIPVDLSSLGLLQAVAGLTMCSKSLSYNFFHLSVQELLAAYHISHIDSSKQMEVFKHMLGSSRFQPVLQYYCGFTKLANPAIQDFISTSSIQQSSLSDLVPFLHCFYEAQDLSLCGLVRSGFTENVVEIDFQQLIPIDYLVISYFILHLLSESSCEEDVCLKIKNIANESQKLKLLLLELPKASQTAEGTASCRKDPKRLKLELCENLMSVNEVRLVMSHLESVSVCSKLTIRDCEISSDGLLLITEELLKINYSHITELQFVETSLEFTNPEKLASDFKKFLEVNKSLTHLTHSNSCIIDSRYIFQGLQYNNTLVHLNLSNAGIDADDWDALTTMLQVNNTLTHLDLSHNKISLGSGNNIFEALQHNTTLLYLNLSDTDLVYLTALSKMLQINKTLTHLDLSVNFISGSSNFFQALHQNTSLVDLNLSETSLNVTEDNAQALTTMLKVNNTLRRLDLSKNTKFLGSSNIFESLQHNKTLVHLNLSDTGLKVTDNTAQALTKMLKVNETLTHLDLSENQEFLKSQNEVKCMCRGLQHNSTLRHLKLRNTGLTKDAISKILKEMNRNLMIDIEILEGQDQNRSQCNVM